MTTIRKEFRRKVEERRALPKLPSPAPYHSFGTQPVITDDDASLGHGVPAAR